MSRVPIFRVRILVLLVLPSLRIKPIALVSSQTVSFLFLMLVRHNPLLLHVIIKVHLPPRNKRTVFRQALQVMRIQRSLPRSQHRRARSRNKAALKLVDSSQKRLVRGIEMWNHFLHKLEHINDRVVRAFAAICKKRLALCSECCFELTHSHRMKSVANEHYSSCRVQTSMGSEVVKIQLLDICGVGYQVYKGPEGLCPVLRYVSDDLDAILVRCLVSSRIGTERVLSSIPGYADLINVAIGAVFGLLWRFQH
jgi:hypothetical protein